MSRLDARQHGLLRQAAVWHARLCSDDASASDRAAWQSWYDTNADHRWAWTQVEALRQRLQGAQTPLSARVLHMAGQRTDGGRRAVLKGLAFCLAGGGMVALGSRTDAWRQMAADYRTGAGEQREIRLADGSLVYLNTDTALDVRYDGQERRLYLHRGEILVETAQDVQARPFFVALDDGTIQALGTRFVVRHDRPGTAFVMVLESAVAIQPRNTDVSPLRVDAGQQAWFHANGAGPVQVADDTRLAWRRGMLVVSDWRLEDFLTELGRYRAGWLSCDARIADFRVSGAFPVRDTDQALHALSESFPVQVRHRTRYWTRVEPSPA